MLTIQKTLRQMKKLTLIFLIALMSCGSFVRAQEYSNYILCKVDGKEWKAEAKRMKIPTKNINYLALAAFKVNPDVQVWIGLFYFTDSLKPGTYPVMSQEELEKASKKKKPQRSVYVLVDYTEETKGMGHAFHDGESQSGNVTISNLTETSVEGTFEATLKGVYFKKRGLATVTGMGLKSNLEEKMITKAGGGMLVNGDPHYHDHTKELKKTDSVELSDGKFSVDWTDKDE